MYTRMVANINIKRNSTGAFYHSCGALLEGQISFFSSVGPPAAAREAFKALASTVLEVENSRSEFWLQIKILLYKSTSGNTKMASEFELVAKQKVFISKIPQFFSGSRNQLISLIIFFCLSRNSNSDGIFVFPVVDLYNRILISSQNSDLEFSTSSTVRPKLQRPLDQPPDVRFG